MKLIRVPKSLQRSDLDRRLPKLANAKDLTGQIFGGHEAVGFVGFLGKQAAFLFACRCGEGRFLGRGALVKRAPDLYSCGCGSRGNGYDLRMRRIWKRTQSSGLLSPEWAADYDRFVSEVGEPPDSNTHLYRIDKAKPMGPDNFRWGGPINAVYIKANGKRKSISEWAAIVGITRERMRQRVHRCIAYGIDPALAVTTKENGSVFYGCHDALQARVDALQA